MNFQSLLGLRLKDDEILEILEAEDMEVIYEFDRTHENVRDMYWAGAKASGFQFRFDHDQKLDVVFLYIVANEGFSSTVPDDVDLPLYESFDKADQAFNEGGISFTYSQADKSWIKGRFGMITRHYEFRDNVLCLVTLSTDSFEEMSTTTAL